MGRKPFRAARLILTAGCENYPDFFFEINKLVAQKFQQFRIGRQSRSGSEFAAFESSNGICHSRGGLDAHIRQQAV
jgi:hypothetical protein